MKRMYRNLGRSAKQAYRIRQETLNLLLAAVGDSIGEFEMRPYYNSLMTPSAAKAS